MVTVTGVDDSIADGAMAYTIVTGPATSADPIFDSIDGDDVRSRLRQRLRALAPIEPAGSLIYTASLEEDVTAAATWRATRSRSTGQETPMVVEPEERI